MKRFLLIQTAFLGDVILATAVAEKIRQCYPESQIDFLVRKGNESVFEKHPFINHLYSLDKKKSKYKNLLIILGEIRKNKYDYAINLQRFGSSGFITAFSGSKIKIGFDKNPFSFLFDHKVRHTIGNHLHETDRNHALICDFTDEKAALPKLYPTESDYEYIRSVIGHAGDFICIAPASVWHTKQFPKEKWLELISLTHDKIIYLVGANTDHLLCEEIKINSRQKEVINLAGKLSLLQTAALMKQASMNYVNDSAPLHIASAMDAPVTVFYCSTVPAFGFGPLSKNSRIIETNEMLSCRPCGIHGHNHCPQGHFKCARGITINIDR